MFFGKCIMYINFQANKNFDDVDFIFGAPQRPEMNMREFIQQNLQSNIENLEVRGNQQSFKPIPESMKNVYIAGELQPVKEFELVFS